MELHNPKFLYHYRRMDVGVREVKDRKIRLSYPPYFDKPGGDSKDTHTSILPTSHFSDVSSLSNDKKELVTDVVYKLNSSWEDDIRKHIRTISMTTDPKVDFMWEEYSEDYGGVCIEYPFEGLTKSRMPFSPVVYQEDTYQITYRDMLNAPEALLEASRYKHIDFYREDEWRFRMRLQIRADREMTPDICQYWDYESDISCVYIGEKAFEVYPVEVESLIKYCDENGIDHRIVCRTDTHKPRNLSK